MFGDFKRIVSDPIGATTSIMTDPLDMVGSGGKIQSPQAFKGKNKKIDQLSLADIQNFMAQGRGRGEQLTGASSKEVGEKRGEIRGKYEDILEGPSRGATRVADARNADIKRLKANQAQGGVSGGTRALQNMQASENYAGQIGDVRQKEYQDALNKLERQYRGASQDIMTAEGQYGAIGVGGKPVPQPQGGGGITYLCTELRKRNMINSFELFIIHALLFIGTIFNPAETILYLKKGGELVKTMNKNNYEWISIKLFLFDRCFYYLLRGRIFKAMNHYIDYVEMLFLFYGLDTDRDRKWKFSNVLKSYKVLREVSYV